MNKQGRNARTKTWLALALAAAAFGLAAAGCAGTEEAADTSAEPEVGESTAAITNGSAFVTSDWHCVQRCGPKPYPTAKCWGYFDGAWEYWWEDGSCGP